MNAEYEAYLTSLALAALEGIRRDYQKQQEEALDEDNQMQPLRA